MPYPLREKTPSRRANRKPCEHYNSYKKTLRDDFHFRCGYCGSFDKIKSRSFTIDHFIPQNPEGCTHTLSPTDYYNLVYSCAYCNGAKSNKWPTNDPDVPNNGTVGFIDPTDAAYDQLFYRDEHGIILQTDTSSNLSLYIRTELNLGRTRCSILWKLEKIDNAISEIKVALQAIEDEGLKANLNVLLLSYYDLTQELYKSDK